MWQPIETAPRDGTWVLLRGGTTTEDDYRKEIGADILRPVVAHWDGNEWAFSYWDGAWRSCYDLPTHWMPLPKPPEA